MKNIHEFLVENNMDVIGVKNKKEVVAAAELLESIGIDVFKNHAKRVEYLESDKVVLNNFMIKEEKDEDGWRIQSHFITDGMSVKELEEKVNAILKTTPDFRVKILQDEIAALKEQIAENEKRMDEINKITDKKRKNGK